MNEAGGGFEVTWDEANMVAAYRLHCSRMWQRKSYAIAGTVFAAVLFLILVGESETRDTAAIVAAAAVSVGVGIALVVLMILANRYASGALVKSWAKQFELDSTVTRFDYDAAGLRITDRMFGGEMRWDEAKGYAEGEEIVLVYRSPQFYYYISKRAAPTGEVAKLVSLMQAAGVRQL